MVYDGILLFDHANLPDERSLGDLVVPVLQAVNTEGILGRNAKVLVRSYGGWFDGESASRDRYTAGDRYRRSCPTVLRVSNTLVRLNFEFADGLHLPSGEATPRISHTVAVRTRPPRLRPSRVARDCHEAGCTAVDIIKWMRRNRGCTSTTCPHTFSECFDRLEQKQVDIHLAVDFLEYVREEQWTMVAIVSDDMDFLPALLRAAMLESNSRVILARYNREWSYLDQELKERGVLLVQLSEGGNCNE